MIAKVSKLLLKLDKGEILDCKGKNLQEIDVNLEDVVEDSENSDEEKIVNSQDKSFVINIPNDDNNEVDIKEEDTVLSKKSVGKIIKTSKKSKKRNIQFEEHSEQDEITTANKLNKNRVQNEENSEEDGEKDLEQPNPGLKKTNVTKTAKNVRIKWTEKE